MVDLIINGKNIRVPKGTTILKACQMNGVDIPTLCYDPDLRLAGSCRMCIVEVKGRPLHVASCVTPAENGMVIETESSSIVESRRIILELLAARHEFSCQTCDKNGSCKFQDLCYQYEIKESRFGAGLEEVYPVDDSNPFIIRDPNKCIRCGKCIRACSEVPGIDNLSFANRGWNSKAATYGDKPYIESQCTFCGTCVEFCPTGALVEKGMHGKARSWEVEKIKTTCPFCGTGCNFDLIKKNDKVIGVRPNQSSVVNKRALCIKGRFGWDFIYNEKRLTKPLIKKSGVFEEAEWDEALDMVASRLLEIKGQYGGDACAVLSSARCTNEDNYLLQKLTRAALGTNNVDHCART